MAFEFHLPDIGEGVVEGEVVGWKVKVGDKVKMDQPIVEIMTDKATVEIPSPRAGTIAKINYADGQICPVGQVLLVIDEEGGAASAKPADAVAPSVAAASVAMPQQAATPATSHAAAAMAPRGGGAGGSQGGMQVIDVTADRARVLATPATRRLARQLGVELARVPATGKHGRITTLDVKAFAGGGASNGAVGAGHAGHTGQGGVVGAAAHAYAPIAIAKGGEEERVPLRGMRKKISEAMARSVNTAAHFTYVEEVDLTELVAVRDRAKDKGAARGIKLTYLPFIVKAVVSGLKKWPHLNASLDEQTQEIVRKKYYHVGIAAQGPNGLVVTNVRDADKRSIFDLAAEIARLSDAVHKGTAARDDLTGSTFTISSLGKLGGLHATPIINFPEVGILGVHKLEERAVVRNGQIVIRWMCNLSISLDHRLVDGWDGAMFLQDVKALLEDPTTMFLEMV